MHNTHFPAARVFYMYILDLDNSLHTFINWPGADIPKFWLSNSSLLCTIHTLQGIKYFTGQLISFPTVIFKKKKRNISVLIHIPILNIKWLSTGSVIQMLWVIQTAGRQNPGKPDKNVLILIDEQPSLLVWEFWEAS